LTAALPGVRKITGLTHRRFEGRRNLRLSLHSPYNFSIFKKIDVTYRISRLAVIIPVLDTYPNFIEDEMGLPQ